MRQARCFSEQGYGWRTDIWSSASLVCCDDVECPASYDQAYDAECEPEQPLRRLFCKEPMSFVRECLMWPILPSHLPQRDDPAETFPGPQTRSNANRPQLSQPETPSIRIDNNAIRQASE